MKGFSKFDDLVSQMVPKLVATTVIINVDALVRAMDNQQVAQLASQWVVQ